MKFLVAILFLAAFLRFFQLSSLPSGLYWDEIDTGYQSLSLLTTGRDYFGNLFPAHLQSFADYRSGLYMYLTVPFIKIFGLTPLATRATAALFSLLTIIISYIFAFRILRLGKLSWVVPLIVTFSPWIMIQGRIAAESQLIIPLVFLGLINYFSKSYKLSAISFALTFWAYPTAKLFVPILILLLFITNQKDFKLKHLIISGIIFVLICALPVYETVFRPVGRRFNEISVLSDPTVAKQIEVDRQQAYLGRGGEMRLGLQVGPVERLFYNKFTYWGEKILANYTTALSSDFLFTSGDPNYRHHAPQKSTGQFYLIEFIPFIFGLLHILKSYFINRESKLIMWWLLLAPLPAVLTRDGGNHSPRLLFLFPAVLSIIALGIKYLHHYKRLFIVYSLVYLFSVASSVFYFFSSYRIISAAAFNSGFIPAANLAVIKQTSYDRVILDGGNESLLMAYLFASKYPPAKFQKEFPLPSQTVANGIEGYKFGNTVILYPGTRDWNTVKLPGRNLIITISTQPNATKLPQFIEIKNPDLSPAFIITEKMLSN